MKLMCIPGEGAILESIGKGLRRAAIAFFAFVWVPVAMAQTADLEVVIAPGTVSPSFGANTFIDVEIENSGPDTATGVTVDFPLPSGLTFVSDLSGGDYNSATGVWTIPGGLIDNDVVSLRLIVSVQTFGDFDLQAEVLTSSLPDPDSEPGNGDPAEDDFTTLTLTPVSQPPGIVCLGRPIVPLNFQNPIHEASTTVDDADPDDPDLGDVFRFVNVAPGADALVEVIAFSAGASLATIDNAAVGVAENLQPSLVAPAGEAFADLNIRVVQTGDTAIGVVDFAASAIDVDGNGIGGTDLREYVEVSDNVVEFAVNDPTELVTTFGTDPAAPASLAADRIRFESETDANAPSISPDVPENIVTAFLTDVAVFDYRVGKFGVAAGGAGRLNSLAFNCPTITPSAGTTTTFIDEDFTDAPASFTNAIHVISESPANPDIRLGATNTAEDVRGAGTAAADDAGDDGITGLPTVFEGGVPVTFDVEIEGAGGLLQGFFDWNADGDFLDSGEHTIVDQTFASASGTFPVTVTPSSSVTGPSFARFRWSTVSVNAFEPASDGEVEDYLINIQAPPPGDLSLTINASPPNPFAGDTTTLTIIVRNDGTETVGNIIALVDLPFGIGFVSSDGGPSFDIGTGIWNVPGDLAPGEVATLQVVASTQSQGGFDVRAEITSADRPDIDSTPANFIVLPPATSLDEDDSDLVSLWVGIAPAGTPVCPADTVLVSQLGNAVSVEDAGAVDAVDLPLALGPLTPLPFAGVPDDVGAQIDVDGDIFVLDLGVIVPENAIVLLQLARDGGAGGDTSLVVVGTSLTNSGFTSVVSYGVNPDTTDTVPDFVSTVQDVLEQVSFAVPAGGARFIEFDNIDDDTFVDGVEFGQVCLAGGELEGTKSVTVFDPLGEGLFALPGNDITYTITVRNGGEGQTDDNSIFLIDELPDEVIFFNGDADGPGPGLDPVNFAEIVPTGLDPFVFSQSVRFAGAGSAPVNFDACGLVPAVGLDPNVRYICFNPQGMMDAGDPDPSFTLSFRARIR